MSVSVLHTTVACRTAHAHGDDVTAWLLGDGDVFTKHVGEDCTSEHRSSAHARIRGIDDRGEVGPAQGRSLAAQACPPIASLFPRTFAPGYMRPPLDKVEFLEF